MLRELKSFGIAAVGVISLFGAGIGLLWLCSVPAISFLVKALLAPVGMIAGIAGGLGLIAGVILLVVIITE